VTAAPAAASPAAGKATAPAPGKAAAPPAPAAPWDWDQPIRELPADYVPEPVAAEPLASGSPASASPAGPTAPLPASPGVPRRPRAQPAVPPSLAEETPLPRNLTPTLVPAPVPTPQTAAPRTKAAEIAEARGKGAVLLDKLLRAGARTKDAPPPSRPLEFKGVDSELLRLQDEALALGLEALRRPD